jgi:CRP/FNR family transcriptional regulator, cyclic AMP receptor protein
MNVRQLVDAIAALDAKDALQCRLGHEGWKLLAPFMSVIFLQPGRVLIQEGDSDRVLYILAEGQLKVQARGHDIAVLQPGTVVGEGAFFSGQARSATIMASQAGVAWALSWDKFEAMSQQYPKLALDLAKGLAAVLATRMREAILVGQFV